MPYATTAVVGSVPAGPTPWTDTRERLTLHALRRATERRIDLASIAVVLECGRAVRHLNQWRISLAGCRRPTRIPVGVWSVALPVVVVEAQSGVILTVFRALRGGTL